MKLTQIIQIGLAAVTAWMAVATQVMARQAKVANKRAKDSIDLERQTLEQMKDALIPVLEFSQLILIQTTDSTSLQVNVRNVGTGPAFLSGLTGRGDIAMIPGNIDPLRNKVLQSKELLTVKLTGDPGIFKKYSNYDWVSSFSIWYADVYERYSRSRIVYKVTETSQNSKSAVRIILSEHWRSVPQRQFSYGEFNAMSPNNHWSLQEGGWPVPLSLLPTNRQTLRVNPEWYSLKSADRVRNVVLVGSVFTNNEPVTITSMSHWVNNWPSFVIQVGTHEEIVIGMRNDPDNDNLPLSPYVISSASINDYRRIDGDRPPVRTGNHLLRKVSDYGFTDSLDFNAYATILYDRILDQVNSIISPTT